MASLLRSNVTKGDKEKRIECVIKHLMLKGYNKKAMVFQNTKFTMLRFHDWVGRMATILNRMKRYPHLRK